MLELPSAILRDFIARSRDMLGRLERDLVELQGGSAAAAARMASALAVIGAGASLLNLSVLERAAWRGEKLLAGMGMESAADDPDVLDALGACVDALRGELANQGGGSGGSERAACEQVTPEDGFPSEDLALDAVGVADGIDAEAQTDAEWVESCTAARVSIGLQSGRGG
jgi:chemotaxis protein histidine kinase CheA